jgi:3-phosphoshikimate 1-carboxyvinyltransferase
MTKSAPKQKLLAKKQSSISGHISVPGDKSISHRAVILSMISQQTTKVFNILDSLDINRSLSVANSLGIEFKQKKEFLEIQGNGLYGLTEPKKELYFGNSGTSMRLLMGILAAQRFSSILTGDSSLNSRPMERLAKTLRNMGANIETENDHAPVRIYPSEQIIGCKQILTVPSAQIKSAILLAALYANSDTVVIYDSITRNHTELMLESFGCPISLNDSQIKIKNGELKGRDTITVPGDFSSASFLILATLMAKDSQILIKNVGLNPTRTGFLKILQMMGADITVTIDPSSSFEIQGSIKVRSSNLKGIIVPNNLVSLSIDELPLVFLAAAFANGTTTITNAAELRFKESDRITTMAKLLTEFSIEVKELKDGLVIKGGTITGGEVDSFGDHRVAMTALIASVCSKSDILVHNTKNIDTSFPTFVETMNQIGMNITQQDI